MKLFVVVAAIFAIVVAVSTRHNTKTQICHRCKSRINGNATACPMCGRNVTPKTDVNAMLTTFLVTFAVTFVILFIVSMM